MIVWTQKQRPRMHTDFSQAYAREKGMHQANQQRRTECSKHGPTSRQPSSRLQTEFSMRKGELWKATLWKNDNFLFYLGHGFFHLLLSDHHSAPAILDVYRVLGFQKKVVMLVGGVGAR